MSGSGQDHETSGLLHLHRASIVWSLHMQPCWCQPRINLRIARGSSTNEPWPQCVCCGSSSPDGCWLPRAIIIPDYTKQILTLPWNERGTGRMVPPTLPEAVQFQVRRWWIACLRCTSWNWGMKIIGSSSLPAAYDVDHCQCITQAASSLHVTRMSQPVPVTTPWQSPINRIPPSQALPHFLLLLLILHNHHLTFV